MAKSEAIGMRTFDAALFHLYIDGKITLDEALKNADSPNNLRLRIDLGDKGETASPSDGSDDIFDGLSLVEHEEPEEDEEEKPAE